MGVNLTNQYIDDTFQNLTQISGSQLTDGTGSLITDLDITASHASASSFATTASYALGSAYASGSGYATSASHAIYADNAGIATNAYSASIAGTANSAIFALTASFAQNVVPIDTGSFVVTGSVNLQTITLEKADGSTFDLTVQVSGSVESASYADVAGLASTASHAIYAETAGTAGTSQYSDNTIVYGKNLSGGTIEKGTPLYFTGSGTAGNIVGVYPADAGNPARMPAAGVAGEQMLDEAEGVVLLDGFINGVNTEGFQSGQPVYVGVGGGYQATRPTGSAILVQSLGYIEKVGVNGSGVIKGSGRANDIPNLSQGYFFVGGTGDVGTFVASSSFAKVAENNVFTGTQTFNNITVNGTGSFAYIQSVTGSAKIIGDAFIVLNNDLPSERYAGVVVQDSGSGSPLTTASLQFDGQLNDWFYQYSTDGGVTTDHGVVMMGPEYSEKGNPTYPSASTLLKGTGTHHIVNSSITDDGALVTVNNPLTVTGDITGNLTGVASSATTASYAETFSGIFTGSAEFTGSFTSLGEFSNTFPVPAVNLGPPPFDNTAVLRGDSGVVGPWGTTYDKLAFEYGYNAITRGGFRLGIFETNDWFSNGNSIQIDTNGVRLTRQTDNGGPPAELTLLQGGPTGLAQINLNTPDLRVGGYYGPTVDTSIWLGAFAGPGNYTKNLYVYANTGSLTVDKLTMNTEKFTISDQTGLDFVSQANVTFESTADNIQFLGNSYFEGSVRNEVTSVSVTSNTGSLDCSQSNFQTLDLIDGQNIHLESSNVNPGQTINLKVTNGASGTGTISFSGEFKFVGGVAPTASLGSNAVDIITFITYNAGGDVYTSAVQNLS